VALRQVSILGLGVIGSSLGLALRRGNPKLQLVGFDIDSETLHRAVRSGAVDRSCGTLAEACRSSDAVVLATPVRAILQLLPEMAAHVEPETLVTDTGGTKAEIVRVAESALPPGAAFVGGHPLTGPLTARVGEPSAKLFDGAVYCLTASSNVPDWAMDLAVELVQTSGAQPHWLDAEEHDGLLAAVSHLPYFASAALVGAVAAQSAWQEMGTMAAGGFRAVSAPTESDPQVWTDVAATNRDNLVRQLDLLLDRLTQLRQLVASGDESLLQELRAAQAAHRGWLAQRGEAPPPPPAPRDPEPAPRSSSWLDRLRRP
jgi:prephenate dehydrogenase